MEGLRTNGEEDHRMGIIDRGELKKKFFFSFLPINLGRSTEVKHCEKLSARAHTHKTHEVRVGTMAGWPGRRRQRTRRRGGGQRGICQQRTEGRGGVVPLRWRLDGWRSLISPRSPTRGGGAGTLPKKSARLVLYPPDKRRTGGSSTVES